MNKDVIYIDVEDDITAIIGKVKDSRQKIVALVPPKRIGVLQSAVNLRLLARAATGSKKHLVIISSNAALGALAAAAKIPVAKNLQSKPELAQISALEIDDGEDVIDGSQMPVGKLVNMPDAPENTSDSAVDEVIGTTAITGAASARATPPAPGEALRKPKAKNGKVPNFNTFRKKFVLIIVGAVLLLGLLIWALFFAPRATVLITARTIDASVNAQVKLDASAETDVAAGVIRSTTQQLEQPAQMEFEATGKKDVGEKATGEVKFSSDSYSALMQGVTIPAGTTLQSSGGKAFTTDSSVTLKIGDNVGTTTVTAADNGASYNGASGKVSGAPSSVNASLTSATSGGTDKVITVVTQEDVQAAMDQLNHQDTDDTKKKLKAQFGKDAIAIESTFVADFAKVTPTPAVGAEASSKAKLSGNAVYSMTGVDKEEVSRFLDAHFAKQLEGKDDQKVYDNGLKNVSFTNVANGEGVSSANIVASAKIGPKINEQAIKANTKGKRYGDIQSSIESINGVQDVDIKFWPFWVSAAPNDEDRIKIEFKLDESR